MIVRGVRTHLLDHSSVLRCSARPCGLPVNKLGLSCGEKEEVITRYHFHSIIRSSLTVNESSTRHSPLATLSLMMETEKEWKGGRGREGGDGGGLRLANFLEREKPSNPSLPRSFHPSVRVRLLTLEL